MTNILHEYETDKGDNVTYYVIHYSESPPGGHDLYWAENVLSLSHLNWHGFTERFVW